MMPGPACAVTSEVRRPSELDAAAQALWSDFQRRTPGLRSAFLSYGFARAAETAHGRVFVAVLREGSAIAGFFPFQFQGPWHACVRLGERIGGVLSDHAGLIARPGFRIEPADLLRSCRLAGLFIDHLSDGQDAFGLAADERRPGHVIDLSAGSAAYFAWLAASNKTFMQDTERRLRRLEKEHGVLEFTFSAAPSLGAVQDLIARKREQYARTGAADPFADPAHLALIAALITARDPDCLPVLSSLSASGRRLAEHFGLLHAGHLSYWFPVYDPEARKVSPGRMLLWHTIRDAGRHGVALIDRGEGDSQAKRDFSNGVRRFGRVNWQAAGWRGLLARTWQGISWRLG